MKKKIFVIIIGIITLIGIITGCVKEEKTPPQNKAPIVSFTYKIEHNTLLDGGIVIFNSSVVDEENDVLTYLWDFDDGIISTIENPIHQFVINGSYTVKLSINDSKNEITKTETIIVGNIVPIAGFTWSVVNLTVTFTDASSDPNEDKLIFAWDFDEDGLIDNETSGPIVYTFNTTGSYNVTLKVTDTWGLFDTIMQEIAVEEK